MGENISTCLWDTNISANRGQSNLQSFMRCVTPVVPVRAHPEDPIDREREHQRAAEVVEFSLGDLWKYYDRPSSYGIGVPVVLDMFEVVVQYYSPSLSAIQIFTKHPSNESATASEPVPNSSSSVAARTETNDDGVSSGVQPKPFGHLYLQFTETCSLYHRPSLTDKIDELTSTYPGLKSFISADLTPYSWVAVAWHPIYQIPERDDEELEACFITYHYLVPSPPGIRREEDGLDGSYNTAQTMNSLFGSGVGSELSLTLFGMASYRMSKGTLWSNPTMQDHVRLNTYRDAAHDWLKILNFYHHDFTLLPWDPALSWIKDLS